MNTPENPEPADEKNEIDPFRLSRLFPEKWDLSEMMYTGKDQEKTDLLPTWYEPFHFPSTIPSGWSLDE